LALIAVLAIAYTYMFIPRSASHERRWPSTSRSPEEAVLVGLELLIAPNAVGGAI